MIVMLMLALCAQDTLTAADVPVIVEEVAEYIRTNGTGGKLLAATDRPIYVAAETARAFRPFVGEALVSLQRDSEAKAYTVNEANNVVECGSDPGACRIVRGGVLVTIEMVEASIPKPGNYWLRVKVQWNDPKAGSRLQEESVVLTATGGDGVWSVGGDIIIVQ